MKPEKEYVKFCFVSSGEKIYTEVIKHQDLKKSYKNAKKNVVKRLMEKFGKYNITDVSFRLKECNWSKISWKI